MFETCSWVQNVLPGYQPLGAVPGGAVCGPGTRARPMPRRCTIALRIFGGPTRKVKRSNLYTGPDGENRRQSANGNAHRGRRRHAHASHQARYIGYYGAGSWVSTLCGAYVAPKIRLVPCGL